MIDRVLLGLLADGGFHSGESLGEALAVSRAAVWKRIAALRQAGLDVHSVRGKGYRLARPLDLLDEQQIRAALPLEARRALDGIEVLLLADSTNDILMARARQGARERVALFAEQQTAGRGRRGRHWVSPFAANIYLSVACEFPGGAATIDGLSLAVGVALCEAIRDLGVSGVALKWPNDLLCHEKKLGGILIEISGEAAGPCVVILGIGVNVGMDKVIGTTIDQPWTDLRSAGYGGTRNQVASAVLDRTVRALDEFSRHGFAAFAGRWRDFDLLRGRQVDVLIGERRVGGVAAGIDSSGALLVDVDGELQQFRGGEVSVRGRQ